MTLLSQLEALDREIPGFRIYEAGDALLTLRNLLPSIISVLKEVEELRVAVRTLRNGYADAVSGLEYVRLYYGTLSGVGFDRVADHYEKWVTIPEREGLLSGSHKLPSTSTSVSGGE